MAPSPNQSFTKRPTLATQHSMINMDAAAEEAALRKSLVGESPYPMYVISLADFLKRYNGTGLALERQQSLRELGLVKKWDGSGEVLFISHEWTDFTHPDHSNIQVKELCLFLERLSTGAIDQVESSWEEQLNFRRKTVVKGKEWKARMANAWIWMDFICVPQLTVENFGDGSFKEKASSLIDGLFGGAPAPAPAKPQRRMSDHRFAGDKPVEGMKELELAIASIPAYVASCSLFVIFAPPAVHAQRTEMRSGDEEAAAPISYAHGAAADGAASSLSLRGSLQSKTPNACSSLPARGRQSSSSRSTRSLYFLGLASSHAARSTTFATAALSTATRCASSAL